ncbi:proteasome chaperone 3 [[Candida] railenensis]|uniref:Proteasome chaperone 3 n=1 Tax=[Candida] railenensis TaxID=45579 RepID=A0A9P0VYB0_9ASCO|nr:proteasome chaperone 3 [[Candida] railenensis]
MENEPFSKTVSRSYPKSDDEIVVSATNLEDKLILNIQINGSMDTTFDIPISTSVKVRQTLGGGSQLINNNEDDAGIQPIVLIGEVNNIKLDIVATQIGKLMLTKQEPKNVILTLGSKWFGKSDVHEEDDFDKLMFILESVKSVI